MKGVVGEERRGTQVGELKFEEMRGERGARMGLRGWLRIGLSGFLMWKLVSVFDVKLVSDVLDVLSSHASNFII